MPEGAELKGDEPEEIEEVMALEVELVLALQWWRRYWELQEVTARIQAVS